MSDVKPKKKKKEEEVTTTVSSPSTITATQTIDTINKKPKKQEEFKPALSEVTNDSLLSYNKPVQKTKEVKKEEKKDNKELKLAEKNLKASNENYYKKQEEYQNAISKELNKRGINTKTTFDNLNNQMISYQTKEQDMEKTKGKPQEIPMQEIKQSVKDKEEEYNQAYDQWKIDNSKYNVAKVNSEDTNLFDKTIGVPIRAIKDLASPITEGTNSYIRDDKGNKTFIPTYNELKQEKVRGDTKGLLGVGQDIVYSGTKVLGAAGLDALTMGVGGKALYWTDMATDNYKNVINQGYSDSQAFLNTAIATGSEFLTEKLLGGFAGKLTGGQASQIENVFANTINKAAKNPKVARILGSMGSEGLEEFTQEYIGALNDYVTLGKKKNIEDLIKDSFYSALVGAGSGGIVNVTSGNVDGRVAEQNTQQVQNRIDKMNELKDTTTNENIKTELDKAINKAQNYVNKPFGKDVNEVNQEIDNDARNISTLLKQENKPTQEQAEPININNQLNQENASNKLNLSNNEQTELNNLKNLPFDYSQQEDARMDELLVKQNKELENKISPVRSLNEVRNVEDMGNKNINAYQYDNPEVKPYFQQTAQEMLSDLKNSTKGERYMTPEGEFGAIQRNVTDDIAELLDGENGYKYSYKDIEKGLNAIIKDNGAENKAVSKRIEFYLDQRLRNGYTDSLGNKIPSNSDYIDTLRNKNIELSNNQQENVNIPETRDEDVLKIETKKHFKDLGANDKVAEVLSEKPKIENDTTLREKIKNGTANVKEEYQWFKRKFVDKGETIYRLSKQLKNKLLYAKYDKMGTSIGEANYNIGKNQTNLDGKKFENFTDKNGKKTSMSLNKIWEGIDPQIGNEYLAHQLNIDRYNQINEEGNNKFVFGPSVNAEVSKNRVTELESQYPELKRFGENVWQYGRNQLQNMVDSGLISQDQANQFIKDTPHYVRLQRNVDSSPKGIIGFDKNGKAIVNKQIQEFKGSNIDILPFKDSMAQQTLDVSQSIRTNLFAQELAKTLGMGTQDNSINSIDENFGINPELIKQNEDGSYSLTMFDNGTATVIPINQGIYEALQPNKHYDFEDKLFFKGVRKFENFRKALLTDKNPLFLATNMMKDAFDAPLNSKHPLLFAKNYIKAIKQIITNGELYQQYQALGGLQNTYFDNEGFQKEGSKANPFTWIEKGNNAIEQFPRLAEFMSTIESGGTLDEAMYNAAEITTNFKRGGEYSKVANRNGITFLNASIQGFSKQVRNFTDIESPKQAVQLLGKIVALGIAPALINDAMWDDDDEYKELQDYQKDNYYLFKGKNGEWIRIPKGRAISVFQSAARRLKYKLKGEEDTFSGFTDFAKNQIAPNSPFENNILSPIVNVKENKSWSGNKIVNDSMSKRPEAEQYNEKTDEFSKWLGKKINYSPMKINYLIDQYSGVVGDVALPMITSRSSSKTNNPIIASAKSKFTLDAVNSNKSVGTFYDTKEEIEKKKNSIKSTPIDVAKNSYMTSQSMQLSELYKKQKEIQNSDLGKKEKYEQAREVQKEINKFAKETVENVKNIEQEKYYLKIGNYYYKRVIKDGEEKYVRDSSKKIPTEKYALYDYFKEKYEKSKEK